ncbi:MAG TPA: hypothetical protein VFV84_12470 [Burkholderiales bacterium]|nr:hypothetical protein [Burkholderiales bacterium]
MSDRERPLSQVPGWIWTFLGGALAAQVALQAHRPPLATAAGDLPPAPRGLALRAASLGEPAAGARLAMLYVQAFDLGAGNSLPYQRLDYHRLRDWLQAILDADPRSSYALFSAVRVYAEAGDPGRIRLMLDFVHQAFLKDPNRRWQWLAQAAYVAKHRLRDLPLARRYAADLERLTTDPSIPLWARQMQIFIAEDMNELEAAKIMIGGLLESGKLQDPGERQFLKQRLEELEHRSASKH